MSDCSYTQKLHKNPISIFPVCISLVHLYPGGGGRKNGGWLGERCISNFYHHPSISFTTRAPMLLLLLHIKNAIFPHWASRADYFFCFSIFCHCESRADAAIIAMHINFIRKVHSLLLLLHRETSSTHPTTFFLFVLAQHSVHIGSSYTRSFLWGGWRVVERN